MQINTLDFNSRAGEVIPLDNIDESLIAQYQLTEKESKLKEICWNLNNADYIIKQQEIKKRNKKLEEKKKLRNKGGFQS